MNFIVDPYLLKEFAAFLPSKSVKFDYPGEVVPLKPYPGTELLRTILKDKIPFEQTFDAGVFCFRDVGMHTDSIYPAGFKTLAIFLKGKGSFQFFESKENYRKKKITDLQVFTGRAVLFDQTLPHSFSLGLREKSCVALLVGLK